MELLLLRKEEKPKQAMNEAMWSDLPHDILVMICKPLTIPDIFSFASVCCSWRSAAALNDEKQHLHRFEMQKPWLVFSGSENTVANFYSISDERFFAIPDQPADQPADSSAINTYFVIGSDHGWIIAADDRSELVLLNPITRQQIDLPPVSTFDHVTPQFESDEINRIISYYRLGEVGGPRIHETFVEHSLKDLRYYLYFKACLSSSPSINNNYTVVVLLDTSYCFAFAKSGDQKWTIIDAAGSLLMRFHNVFYHNNDISMVYFTNNKGEILTCDLNSNQFELTLIFPYQDWETYLNHFNICCTVYSPWGDLLYVRRVLDEAQEVYWTKKIEVYKIDLNGGTKVKVENLGQYALFVGGNHPICISVEDASFLKKNCVYFTDDCLDFMDSNSRNDIGIYNLDDGSIESILPEDSLLFWPPPVWFTPSLV